MLALAYTSFVLSWLERLYAALVSSRRRYQGLYGFSLVSGADHREIVTEKDTPYAERMLQKWSER
jgi:hypothetical protein